MVRPWFAVMCVLLNPLMGFAQERLDAQGDLLPAGAIMRLGTTRWRNDNGYSGIACTPDGKWIVGLC